MGGDLGERGGVGFSAVGCCIIEIGLVVGSNLKKLAVLSLSMFTIAELLSMVLQWDVTVR